MAVFRSWLVVLAFSPTALFAATSVKFSEVDLRALVQLAQPGQTALRFDGRRGEFRPGPSLRFAGLEPEDFEIDLSLGADLVDLRFNDLRAKTLSLVFETNRARLDFAIEDREKAIKSALGSVSLKGVVVSAWVRFAADGSSRLVFDEGAVAGELKGTGLLKPRWVIDGIRKTVLKSLKTQVERQLARVLVQDSIEKGLVVWARFSADERLARVVRGSAKVSASGLRYEAE